MVVGAVALIGDVLAAAAAAARAASEAVELIEGMASFFTSVYLSFSHCTLLLIRSRNLRLMTIEKK
jgi:hypothetical protein